MSLHFFVRTSLRLATRVQIFPDPGQENVLWHLSDRCRLLYNFALQEIGRDRNSAINMMVRFLSHNATWTGYPEFVDNLRKAGLNISMRPQDAPPERVG
jgi:hypothetical protein